jgi:hypothetical protein
LHFYRPPVKISLVKKNKHEKYIGPRAYRAYLDPIFKGGPG